MSNTQFKWYVEYNIPVLYAKYNAITQGNIWFYTDYPDLSGEDIRFFKQEIVKQCLKLKTIPYDVIPENEYKVEEVSIILIQPIRKEKKPTLLHEHLSSYRV
jgi:hypothetical protein